MAEMFFNNQITPYTCGLACIESIAFDLGKPISQAELLAQESLELARELGTKPLLAVALDSLTEVALARGQHQRALDLVNERIALTQTLGDIPTIVIKHLTLSEIALKQGDPLWALELVEESLSFFRQQADHLNIAVALGILGDIALAGEDVKQAMIFYKDALSLYMKTGNTKKIAKHLIRLAKLCKKYGPMKCAAYILNIDEIWQKPLPPALRNDYNKIREWLLTQMDETTLREIQSQEQPRTLEQLLKLLEREVERLSSRDKSHQTQVITAFGTTRDNSPQA